MPPLLSLGEKQLKPEDRKMTGKIMSLEHGLRETYIGNFLKLLPFSRNYFVFTTDDDASKLSDKQTDKEIALCKKTQEEALASLYMYKMPFGGQVLYEQLRDIDLRRFNFWEFGKILLEGLSLMITHGVLHTDLHTKNILVDEYYVPRVIDWGLSIIIQSSRESDIRSIVDSSTAELLDKDSNIHRLQMPPEIFLFQAEKNGMRRSEIVNYIVANDNRRVLNRALNSLFGITEDDLRQQLVDFQTTSAFFANAKNDSAIEWFKTQGQYKFDTWGAGAYLARLLSQLNRYSNILADPKYATKKSSMMRALRGLCEFNPKRRLNAVQALSIWDSPNNHIIRAFGRGWLS